MSLVYNPQLGARVAVQSGTLSGNTLGDSTYSGTNVILVGGSNVTFQGQGDSVYVHAGGGGGGTPGYSAANGSATFQTLTFANSGGVSWSTGTQGIYVASLVPGAAAGLGAAAAGSQTGTSGTINFVNSNGITFGMSGSSQVTASHNGYTGATTQFLTTDRLESLNEIQNPAADAVFSMNTRQIQFQWGTNFTAFTTGVNRQGLFEIDVVGPFTDTTANVDVVHIHQSTNNQPVDLVHLEAASTAVTALRIHVAGSIAAEINQPIKFTHSLSTSGIGSVPMIVPVQMSNSVANLNANYLEGKRSSDFQAPGAYLTTARASSDAIGLNSGLTANGVSMTANSSGLSLNFPAFLTTAALVTHTHGSAPSITGSISVTSNSSAWSISIPAFITTYAAQTVQPAVGLNTAQSNVTWTVNSSGISINANGYAGTGTTANNASITLNSAGLAISVAAPGAGGGVAIAGSGASTVTGGTVQFGNLNGFSFGLNGSTMTGSYTVPTQTVQPVAVSATNGSYAFSTLKLVDGSGVSWSTVAGSAVQATVATSYRASNDAVGLGTTATNVTWTVGSAGIQFNAAGYAGTGTSATNASITMDSNGLAISVAAPGGGAGVTMSAWEPKEMDTGTAYSSHPPGTTYWQPMVLPSALAVKYAYVPKSVSVQAPAGTSSAINQTMRLGYTHAVSVFSRRDYANSSGSLTYVTHGSLVATFSYWHATGNQSAALWFVTDSGGGTTSTSSTSGASANLAAYFNGPRLARIIFPATTLAAGEYFLAQGHSTSFASTGGTSSNPMLFSNLHQVPVGNSAFQRFGSTNATSSHVGPRTPLPRGVANAITSNANMNSTAISVQTVNDWYIVLANY